MQVRNENILTSTDKLIAFTKKGYFMEEQSEGRYSTLDMFPLVRKTCVKKMIPVIVEHLTCLGRRVEEYFPSISVDEFDWIRNPLVNLRDSSNFAICEEKESASLSSNRGLRMNNAELTLDAFWFSIMQVSIYC